MLLLHHQVFRLADAEAAAAEDVAGVGHGGVGDEQALVGAQALLADLGADAREVDELQATIFRNLAGDPLELRATSPRTTAP